MFVPVNQAQRFDMATQLLAAAAKLGMPASVVRSLSNGYEVPEEVLAEAGVVLVEGGATEPETAEPKRRGRPPGKGKSDA